MDHSLVPLKKLIMLGYCSLAMVCFLVDWPLILEKQVTTKWCKLKAKLLRLGFKFTLQKQRIGASVETGKFFESCGCLLLVCRDDISSIEFTIYEMMKGSSVWSVRFLINIVQLLNLLPEGWSIRTGVWSICLGEGEEDAFVVINLSRKRSYGFRFDGYDDMLAFIHTQQEHKACLSAKKHKGVKPRAIESSINRLLHRGRNFLESFDGPISDPILLLMELPHMSHLEGKFFESCGCLLLVCRDDIGSTEFTIYEMMKGSSVWSIRYLVNIVQLLNRLPEGWSIRTCVWSICLGEDDAFMVINLSGKVVKYNLISNTNTKIFDIGSNQMDDDDDDADDDAVLFIPPFEVDHNLYEFIPSLASV
nr:hypothetical protein [Tanacetum cinerariifolium]